jgi:hypothetical protein
MSDLEIWRYKAAVAELKAAGLYNFFRNDDGPSLFEIAFQSGRPFEYLSLRRNLVVAALAVILISYIGTFLLNWYSSDPISSLFLRIVLQSLLPTLAVIAIVWRKARRHGLTPWEDLAR